MTSLLGADRKTYTLADLQVALERRGIRTLTAYAIRPAPRWAVATTAGTYRGGTLAEAFAAALGEVPVREEETR